MAEGVEGQDAEVDLICEKRYHLPTLNPSTAVPVSEATEVAHSSHVGNSGAACCCEGGGEWICDRVREIE